MTILRMTHSKERMPRRPLVVGIGQTLRGDDGIGWKVAERFEELHPNVADIVFAKPLLPEHAEPISRASVVVLIDASIGNDNLRVSYWPMSPLTGAPILAMTHSASIEEILAYVRGVFGESPPIALVTIGVHVVEFGEDVSPEVSALIDPAVNLVYQCIHPYRSGER